MPARWISALLVLGLSIFAISLPGSSVAQVGQLQAYFETAIRNSSTSPYIVLITVVDDRTGQASTGCTNANFLRGAIYIEKWGAMEKKVTPETKERLEEAQKIALENTSHVFHFSNQAALDNVPLRYPQACPAIEQGMSVRIGDRTGQMIVEPFVARSTAVPVR